MPKKEPKLQLRLATFCKVVLTETGTSEQSLIGILPALILSIALPKGEAGQKLPIPIASGLSVFSVFERNTPIDEPYDPTLEVRISGPFEGAPALTGNLNFPPGVKFSQMPIKFQSPVLTFSPEDGKDVQETEIKVVWVLDNVIIGTATLPITMKRVELINPNVNDSSAETKV